MADSSDETPAVTGVSPSPRTAVVVVHGMGEQLPLETLRHFVMTGLPTFEGKREYFSRPALITGSFEARRMLAPRRPLSGPISHGQTEFFEYHWSYKMTGNRLSDFVPTFVRLMLRTPKTVPSGLKVIWTLSWLVIVALAAAVVATIIAGVRFDDFTLGGVLVVLFGQGIVAVALLKLLSWLGSVVTRTFVDVSRYLDRSPRSYSARRDIRKGMVDLLRGIHEDGRYSRVVVVAHSLGGYIAYDGLTSYWSELRSAEARKRAPGPTEPFAHLGEVERMAREIGAHPVEVGELGESPLAALDRFREAQFELWRDCRKAGNPWLVTDFITLGTPMYFADLLFTKNRSEFGRLVQNSELPQCPPCAGDEMVEGVAREVGHGYGYTERGRHYLAHSAPFAVVRWSNLYFPAERGFFGDWFGGPLRPLFGRGILDIPITGNLPGRRAPGLAHGRYFLYPDSHGPHDVATVLQRLMRLTIDDELP